MTTGYQMQLLSALF